MCVTSLCTRGALDTWPRGRSTAALGGNGNVTATSDAWGTLVPDLTLEQLRQMVARSEAATPGPWRSFVEGRDHTSGDSFIRTSGDDLYLTGASVADQDFIASARQDVPALAAEIARLRGWRL